MCKLSGEIIFTCAKCKGRDIGVRYIPKYEVIREGGVSDCDGTDEFFGKFYGSDPYSKKADSKEGHLLLTCKTCGYSWRRATMDKSASNV